ncbi:MAG: hypothetical protein CMJ49_07550 [Planctomycetaceae bacterium]|nr:hypothetical protein [Planctomycetaceae bacterium]
MAKSPDQLDLADNLLTDLESIEARLTQLQQGLTRSHRLATLGTMATIIAHEFNNILTPVISYCQLALAANEPVPDLYRKAVEKSLKGAERAAAISSSMLGFAREADGSPVCCVREVIDEVFSCLAREPEKDGIQLTINVPDDCWVRIPPIALQQVLLNLVLNARQAMRKQRGKLLLHAEPQGDLVRLIVADTGPGIPPELIEQIFEPFVSKRDPAPGDAPGNGLGLTVCRDLIHGAHGTITVDSPPDHGATFTICLHPADPPDEAAAA